MDPVSLCRDEHRRNTDSFKDHRHIVASPASPLQLPPSHLTTDEDGWTGSSSCCTTAAGVSRSGGTPRQISKDRLCPTAPSLVPSFAHAVAQLDDER